MSDFAQHAADLFGLTLSAEQVAAFDLYAQALAAWNAHTNLTAIIEPEAVRVRHFLDSLSLVGLVKGSSTVLDVGTGAGFPGLPLAMVYPDVQVTLLESTGKKIKFLEHIAQQLGLKNVHTLNARAEDAGHLPDQRGRYDVVVARAVARMPALVEYLLPFARVGGKVIAMKGDTAQQETQDAKHALQLLGGRLNRIESVQLPGLEQTHYLVIIEKTDPTPAGYPRKPGIPTRKPL
ncbi:MAG: 16S rRNA (guanine(527)-N(7))-methyltransferase RsmG [Anaerolineae bacterium]